MSDEHKEGVNGCVSKELMDVVLRGIGRDTDIRASLWYVGLVLLHGGMVAVVLVV